MIEQMKKQLFEAEQHLEKVKAELYSTVGKIATLKELIETSQKETK